MQVNINNFNFQIVSYCDKMITANLDESYLHRLDNLYLVAEKGEQVSNVISI